MTKGYWYPQPKDDAELNKIEGVRTVSYSSSLSFGDGLLWWLRNCLKHGRPGFNPWVGNIPWRRAWQPILVFLPGKSPWTEEPDGLQSLGSQKLDTTQTKNSTLMFIQKAWVLQGKLMSHMKNIFKIYLGLTNVQSKCKWFSCYKFIIDGYLKQIKFYHHC